jgi:hypothetical protein
MGAMDLRALGTLRWLAAERYADQHADRDPKDEPDTHVSR